MEFNFSSVKKYYFSYQVSTGEEGWYNYTNTCAPGGARILRKTSPPTSLPVAMRNNFSYKKRIRVDGAINGNKKSIRVDEENAINENRLIQELTSNTIFLTLYLKIINARRNNNHAVLENYYFLGVELEKRLEYYKMFLNTPEAQKKVSKEVRDQLPNEITNDDIRKNTLIARKINNFFVRLSDDKDQRMAFLQRIKTITADFISNLSSENVEYVVSRVIKDSK
jgi:hypothetical protein